MESLDAALSSPTSRWALLAIRMSRADPALQSPEELEPGIWFSRDVPFELPSDVTGRFGTNRAAWLKWARNYFVAVSREPGRSETDTHELERSVYRYFLGLAIAVPSISHDGVVTIAGAIRDDGVRVHSWEQFPSMRHVLHNTTPRFTREHLTRAACIAQAIDRLARGKSHDRMWRMLRAFRTALESDDIGYRVHQCVRCAEGLILPGIGRAKADFGLRGSLFVRPEDKVTLLEMYDIRSSVEHLHGPLRHLPALASRERAIRLLTRAVQAEALARECLTRLFMTEALWPYMQDRIALEQFWMAPEATRKAIWGAPIDLDAVAGGFASHLLTASDLGIEDDDADVRPPASDG